VASHSRLGLHASACSVVNVYDTFTGVYGSSLYYVIRCRRLLRPLTGQVIRAAPKHQAFQGSSLEAVPCPCRCAAQIGVLSVIVCLLDPLCV
jgi:hypothetical protein